MGKGRMVTALVLGAVVTTYIMSGWYLVLWSYSRLGLGVVAALMVLVAGSGVVAMWAAVTLLKDIRSRR